MHDPEDARFESEPFDPDDVVWVREVDYVAGWRDATEAGGELADALESAGFDTAGLEWKARTSADGAGRVRLVLSAAAAHDVAALVRAVARLDKGELSERIAPGPADEPCVPSRPTRREQQRRTRTTPPLCASGRGHSEARGQLSGARCKGSIEAPDHS